MEKSKSDILIKELKPFAKAKNPINVSHLEKIRYFTDIFPEKELWSVLVRLSKKDLITHEEDIPYLEQKDYKEGDKLITKGLFDQTLFWLLSGHLHIVTSIKDHTNTIHESKAGECIGELSVIRGSMRTADVLAGEGGASVLQLDWSIIERSPELGKDLYHLIALHLADKLDKAYGRQIKIITNSINMVHTKAADLIKKNKKLEKILYESSIDYKPESQTEQSESLIDDLAKIIESLSHMEVQEGEGRFDLLGII